MRLVPDERSINLSELPVEDTERPAITDDVVQHHDQDMILGSQADQGGANAGLGGQIVRPPRLLDQETFDLGVALLVRPPGKVDVPQPERPALVDHLNRSLIDDVKDRP